DSPLSRPAIEGLLRSGTAKSQARFLLRGRIMSVPVQTSQNLRVFLALVICVAVLRYAQDVFLPLALAILLTFLLAPLVNRLQKLRINRTVAVVFSVALTMLIIGGLLWVVFHQFTD